MRSFINRFCNDTSGATAIEYGVIAALIAVVIITATKVLGMSVFHKLREVLMAIRGF
ncbi:MAG: Flp family type IVb pilin [Alphaproteobacteria bacterium]|nr:MAG: Flp family type IVb pilin [Alphaproteobacteria bacterium]PZO34926.1 MAG: Flp family type IVb pilin [Alphaproteobacteria bacterium]